MADPPVDPPHGPPLGAVVVDEATLARLADRALERAEQTSDAAGGDDQVVFVRLTRRELREVREAAKFYGQAGYGLRFLERVGKWAAAVGALAIAVKLMFPHLFTGGGRP